MSAIDSRIARRRHIVAENSARRRLRSMIVGAVVLAVVGLGWWATQSELLDIDVIAVSRTVEADVGAALAEAGISEGTPLVSAILAAPDLESALEDDPWVSAATVSVLFPGRLEVEVVERTAAATIAVADGGWMLAASDLTLLERVASPRGDLGIVADGSIIAEGLSFLAVLGELAPGTTLSVLEGEVWAERGGIRARLGRSTEIEAKAAAFAAMLTEDIPEGWAINLMAPSRPALFEAAQP